MSRSFPGPFSLTRILTSLLSRTSPGFGMVSARVRGAAHEKGYPNGGGDLDPESRPGGGRTEGWTNQILTFNFTPSPPSYTASDSTLMILKNLPRCHSFDPRMARQRWRLGFVQYQGNGVLFIVRLIEAMGLTSSRTCAVKDRVRRRAVALWEC